jgi:hypothetical protein
MSELTLPDGTPVLMGCNQPDVLRFSAVPKWDDANDVIPESQWEEHDDYAAVWPEIRAQKNNNCTNAAIGNLMEAAINAAQGGDCPRLSWSFLYSMFNGGSDSGAFCRELADAVRYRGLARESLYPDSKIFAPRGGYSQEVLDDAKQHTAVEVYQCMNKADVGSALTRRFLVYHGFVLGNAFFNTRADGIVPEFDGSLRNGHAMASRGLKRINGNLRPIVPNTWGPSFGDRGVGYVPWSYFWGERGNFVNLDCYAIRAVKTKPLVS